MDSENFVDQVRESIIKENAESYRTLLDSTPHTAASDPYWRSVLELHERLSAADRQVLYSVMRQVSVDTISNIFAVLDGSTRMQGQAEDLALLTTKTNQRLNGPLQDLLLEKEERDSAPG